MFTTIFTICCTSMLKSNVTYIYNQFTYTFNHIYKYINFLASISVKNPEMVKFIRKSNNVKNINFCHHNFPLNIGVFSSHPHSHVYTSI